MDSFKKMVPQTASVIRGGKRSAVDAENLTIGDLIEVKGGDKLPADIRVVSCSSFKVKSHSDFTSDIPTVTLLHKCN